MKRSRFIVVAAIAATVPACFASYEKSSDDSDAGSNAGSNAGGSAGAAEPSSSNAGGGGVGPGCQAASPICTAGEVDPEPKTQPCGACSKGTQSGERTCSANCTWGGWTWSACDEGTYCQPGSEPHTRTVACPCGDSKTQQQTCSDSCTWGDWTDTSICDISCCATLVYCNASRATNPVPGRGTWCREKTAACSQDEVKNDCYRLFLEKCPSTDSFEPVYYD